ncbi:MAG TPA: hypothetical protein DDZ91_10015 [Firmicutes bacterium]|jgi:hypothetical protein|nr:hypothetical protein [Bacillota bacterium]
MPKIHDIKNYNIYIYYQDHQPPHVHIRYKKMAIASMTINDVVVLEGTIPITVDKEIRSWIISNREDLLKMWEKAVKGDPIL